MDTGWTSCLPEFACKKRNKLRQATDHLDSVSSLWYPYVSPYLPLVIPKTSLLCQMSLTGSESPYLDSPTCGLSCIVRNDTPIRGFAFGNDLRFETVRRFYNNTAKQYQRETLGKICDALDLLYITEDDS